MELNLTIIGEPKPKQSCRFAVIGGHVRKYQKREVVANENDLKIQAIQQLPTGFIPTSNPLTVKVNYFFAPIKSLRKKDVETIETIGRLRKTTKPDLTDNLNKGTFDALQGVVYLNDSQIYEVQAGKYYAKQPRTEIKFFIED